VVIRCFVLLLFFSVFSKTARCTDYTFDYTPACAQAYKAYLALRPDIGDALIRGEIAARPRNLMAVYISDYGDFLTLLFNGDPARRTQRATHEDERLKMINKGSDDDPWKRLALAGIHLHQALIHVRSGEQFKAAISFRKSYSLLKENDARFPKFAPTAVLYGTEEAIAGTIPDEYDWLMAIFGMKGNLPRGTARLADYLKTHTSPDSPLHEEAVIYDCYIRFYLGSAKATVWQLVSNDAAFDIRGNLLRAFVRANLALSFRRADAAVGALQAAIAMPGAQAYPVFDYEMGCAQLLRLDLSCTTYLERYVSRNTGMLFTKDALQNAALAWYLKGNKAKAVAMRASILNQGSLNTDADRQAQRFAKSDNWPHPLLLTARMLIDGGYYAQALAKLRTTTAAAFTDMADRLEYDFRLGRALEESGDATHAVQAYQRVINNGRNRPEHFAARSALQMAGIYEQRGQTAEARRYYKLCRSMRDHDFQASIDQQAKAGLGRIGE
jgi:tetratricopeptide (TPR) repeat protein